MAPRLLVLPDEPQRDRAALEQLAGWALRFSPTVEPVEPGTLLIDITGCQRLFGGEDHILRLAADGLAQRGFQARAAIADTVGAAFAVAAVGTELPAIVPVGHTSAWLAPLPPDALRIEPQVSERLKSVGLRSIGDLLMLPRATLPARFGPQLVLRLQQALGEVIEALRPYRPPAMPLARLPFEPPVSDGQTILAAAEHLLAGVFQQLRRRELALRRLECVIYYDRLTPRVISVGLARASRRQAHVATVLAQRLEQIDATPGVTGLMLVAQETTRFRGGQGELFEPREAGDQEALGCLIDRLAGRLGYPAVLWPRRVDDHQPEMAFRYVSVADAGCEPEGEVAGSAVEPLAARPVRLLPRPVPIRVIALVPDGPPRWFAYRGREHVVAGAEGPERLETAWWRGRDVRRDYFRVTTETGEQFWIFRAADEERWYLHGVFA